MRTVEQIEELLNELDHVKAEELEDQDLDFKQWDVKSLDKSVQLVVRMAVCMANGGGGTIVFGVADKVLGRKSAILGIPLEVDVNILKKAVYDQTDPKIMPVFLDLRVPEGTERLLVMQIHHGLPPYTDTAGRGTVRIGKDCQPLTGHPERDRRIDWEAAKTRILSILMDRFNRGEPGLSNQDIRQITHFDRNQVFRLMKQLRLENPKIQAPGKGKHARYTYEDK